MFHANRPTTTTRIISGKKPGAQPGHSGHGRVTPPHVDREVRVSLSRCPDCQGSLKCTDLTVQRTIIDLPEWKVVKPVVTQYTIERQWCSHCHREVRGVPGGVLPFTRFGVNLWVMVLILRYRLRLPIGVIQVYLKSWFGINLSSGGMVKLLKTTQQKFKNTYDQLLAEIRGSPTKHADETGWRVRGKNWWVWTFLSGRSVYYTIEETRGKGIPQNHLKDSSGVLVRDDYAAYQSLDLPQQSCWAHLLRKSHEAAVNSQASREAKLLHLKLKDLYGLLSEDLTKSFDQGERQELYGWYKQDVQNLITIPLESPDALRIQTRLRNQGENLITALLYEGVPLTNNAAERAIRPFVITRKISGGSRSKLGATTHAINMSIVQTISKRNVPLFRTLKTTLLSGFIEKK